MKQKKKKPISKETIHLFISPDSKTKQNKREEAKPSGKNIVFKTYKSFLKANELILGSEIGYI